MIISKYLPILITLNIFNTYSFLKKISRKRKKDYKKVLQQILKLLPSQPVAERLVADFEDVLWRAVKTVFLDIHIQGYSRHRKHN
jgi:hypothetical protein